MKSLLILIAFFTFTLVSCNKNTRHKITKANSVKRLNKINESFNKDMFFPEFFTKIETDTIIDKKLRVHIKNYSLMTSSLFIKKQTIKNQPTITKYQRVFEANITVYNNQQMIYQSVINANTFYNLSPKKDLFWKNATLQHAWLNEAKSNKNKAYIELSFTNPLKNNFKRYVMEVDQYGAQHIYFIEEYT